MIYSYVSAIGRQKLPGSAWLNVDLSGMTMTDCYALYDEVHIVLQSAAWTPTQRSVRLSDLRAFVQDYSLTLEQLLDAIGNQTIPSSVKLPKIRSAQARYADAYWAGYQLRRARYALNPNFDVDETTADCLVMKKEGVSSLDFFQHCLVSINGLIHRVDADNQWIYVMDAQKSSLLSRRNEVGIINFKSIGELECISITPDMVHRRTPNQPMAVQMYIKAPKPALNKTVALVFGGYLHLLDNLSFVRVAEDIFMFDTQSVPMLERYYESQGLIDLSPLKLVEVAGKNKKQISRSELYSDEVLTRWITLSQSFLVYIDNDSIDVHRRELATSKTFGQYLAYSVEGQEPREPLQLGYGLLAPYAKHLECGVWSVTVGDNLFRNFLFQTSPRSASPNPADNCEPMKPAQISSAAFVDITSNILYFE